MKSNNIHRVLDRVYESQLPAQRDLEFLLGLEADEEIQAMFDFADAVRKKHVGNGILLRGIVEFSSYCRNTCYYCGLNKNNTELKRYRLTKDEILQAVENIARVGIKTVVLQSGEDDELDAGWLGDVIKKIKENFDMAVTLSVGQWDFEDYQLWKCAGADRYLLKIETTDEDLYNRLHPQMSFDQRLKCSRDLAKLGYQNGSGCLVGLKGQTIESLAKDILFFKNENFDMIGIGLFIPHENTPLGNEALGSLKLALKTLAVTRIVTRDTHLPATTAIGSAGGVDQRVKALEAGANVIMPNFTPSDCRKLYEIYPGKKCISENWKELLDSLESLAKATGRTLDFSRGNSLKGLRIKD